MCVTNTTLRRPQAVSFPIEQIQPGKCASALSQRLMGTFALDAPTMAVPRAAPESPTDKLRTKRRRKPQQPGMTAKHNERHFVEHNYHDHSNDVDENDMSEFSEDLHRARRGGVAIAFPERLHQVLQMVEHDGLGHIVSWQPHGRCFLIHKPREFVDHVMPRYFRQTKLTSFQRQLNLYGFQRLTRGNDAGAYYHELFLRNKEFLCKGMVRIKIKGTKYKAASSPEQEPDFYRMPPVASVTPTFSSDEEASFDSSMRSAVLSAPPMQQPSGMPMQSVNYYSTQPPVVTTTRNYFAPVMQVPPQSFYSNNFGPPSQTDNILDEAVDELFMGELDNEDNIADFVNEWETFGAVLADDVQLGYMLEKLLED